MIEGIININKEKGPTSFDVIYKLRKITGIKKIGHTGTLDPMAQGVLPVAFGRATKLVDMLTDKDKEYLVTMKLGIETDTYDATGEIVFERDYPECEEQIREAIMSFRGELWQKPPMYSAIKVQGKKLYELARKGHELDLEKRQITIYGIEIMDMSLPEITLRVECSKGTYIRSLCHDIGEKLHCGACMTGLERTRSGDFTLLNSVTVDDVNAHMCNGTLDEILIKPDYFFREYPEMIISPQQEKLIFNGNPITGSVFRELGINPTGQCIRIYNTAGEFMALYEHEEKRNLYKPKYMFEGAFKQ